MTTIAGINLGGILPTNSPPPSGGGLLNLAQGALARASELGRQIDVRQAGAWVDQHIDSTQRAATGWVNRQAEGLSAAARDGGAFVRRNVTGDDLASRAVRGASAAGETGVRGLAGGLGSLGNAAVDTVGLGARVVSTGTQAALSSERRAEVAAQVETTARQVGGAVVEYGRSVAADPGRVVSDAHGVAHNVERAYDRAVAEGRGPEAVGAAIATVGTIFTPGGGARTAVRGAEAVADGARLARGAEAVADGDRLARGAETVVEASTRARVVMEGGRRGDWPAELNAQTLKPDMDYVVNGHKYTTDAKGRVVTAQATKLDLTTADRNGYQQRIAGRVDRLPDDQGGHLIASIFNGPGDRLNLVAMNGNLNQGAWKAMENRLAAAVQDGKSVEVKVEVAYNEGSARPDRFRVTYSIDGDVRTRAFLNQPEGK